MVRYHDNSNPQGVPMRQIWILLCLIVVGCGSDPKEEIHSAVKGKLKDPNSAVFQNDRKLSDYLYCGQVNAKNSLGGFVGYSPFVAIGARADTGKLSWSVSIGEDDAIVDAICIQGLDRTKAYLRNTDSSGEWIVVVRSTKKSVSDVESDMEKLGYQPWMIQGGASIIGPYSSEHMAQMVGLLIGVETVYERSVERRPPVRTW